MRYRKSISAFGLLLGLNTMNVQAALQSRAGGTMVYDDILNVTWVADASLFRTLANASGNPSAYVQSVITANNVIVNNTPNQYDGNDGIYNLSASDFNTTSGRMNWFAAKAWVSSLSYGGFDDWRLPTKVNNTCSPNSCGYTLDTTSGELVHMYYANLGLKSWVNPDGTRGTQNGLFGNGVTSGENNIGFFKNIQSAAWWIDVEGTNPKNAGYFNPKWGSQDFYLKNYMEYVPWAVRTGDVAAVPVPGAVWLFGTGLALLGLKRRSVD